MATSNMQTIEEIEKELEVAKERRFAEDSAFVTLIYKRLLAMNFPIGKALKIWSPFKTGGESPATVFFVECTITSSTRVRDFLKRWTAKSGPLKFSLSGNNCELTLTDEKHRVLVEQLLYILQRQSRSDWYSIMILPGKGKAEKAEKKESAEKEDSDC